MSIDVFKDELLDPAMVTKLLPTRNGRKKSISTIWRWCMKGLHDVHLEHVWLGRRIFTTREAINRFFNDLAKANVIRFQKANGTIAKVAANHKKRQRPQTPLERQHSIAEAERVLREAGI